MCGSKTCFDFLLLLWVFSFLKRGHELRDSNWEDQHAEKRSVAGDFFDFFVSKPKLNWNAKQNARHWSAVGQQEEEELATNWFSCIAGMARSRRLRLIDPPLPRFPRSCCSSEPLLVVENSSRFGNKRQKWPRAKQIQGNSFVATAKQMKAISSENSEFFFKSLQVTWPFWSLSLAFGPLS